MTATVKILFFDSKQVWDFKKSFFQVATLIKSND